MLKSSLISNDVLVGEWLRLAYGDVVADGVIRLPGSLRAELYPELTRVLRACADVG